MKSSVLLAAMLAPSLSSATCLVESADKTYRIFTEKVANTKAAEDISIYSYFSERNERQLRKVISSLLKSDPTSEDIQREPLLAKPLALRKRIAMMSIGQARFVVPAETRPEVSESSGGVILKYSWRSTREDFDSRENVPVVVVTQHEDEIFLVCEGEWKVDSDKHKLVSEVYSKDGVRIKDSYLASDATFRFPGE